MKDYLLASRTKLPDGNILNLRRGNENMPTDVLSLSLLFLFMRIWISGFFYYFNPLG